MEIYYEDEDSFIQYLNEKKIFLWGVGNAVSAVVSKLRCRGISSYMFIDSNPNKWGEHYGGALICSPDELAKYQDKSFVIISCCYEKEISEVLSACGYQRYRDYIDGLNLDNEFCVIRYRNILPAKPLTLDEMSLIEKEMYRQKIDVRPTAYRDEDIETLETAMDEFKGFYNKGRNPFYKRKMCEYLLNYGLLGLKRFTNNDIYVDVGSSASPAALILREKHGINAYAVDLCKSSFEKEYYLQEDATNTSFAENSVSGMSLQSSYCLFIGDADINFVRECQRILKPGGKVCVSPLYLYKEYASLVSPQYYQKGYSDVNAKEYIRRDWPNIKMSRYYDVINLKKRVLDVAERLGMKATVFVLDNSQVPEYEFAYLKFILTLEK